MEKEKSTVATRLSGIKPAQKVDAETAELNKKTATQREDRVVGAMFRAIAGMDGRQIVIVCFGTTAISGDSLGPAVGNLLRDKYKVPAFVYGTQEHCVNGKNMGEWMEFIKSVHEGALFIAVDASLGGGDKVGKIILRSDGVCPAGIKGKTERFGDVGILGVVARNSTDPLMQLMTVSPLYVAEMADKISVMIKNAIC